MSDPDLPGGDEGSVAVHDVTPDSRATDTATGDVDRYLRPETPDGVKTVVYRAVARYHRSNLPSAEELAGLERVLPGAAERYMAMSEKEQAHRHDIDRKIVDREFRLRFRGQTFALVALLLLLGVISLLAFLGATGWAAALGGATIIGVVSVFALGQPPAKANEPPPEN